MTRRTLVGRVLVAAGAVGFVGALVASVVGLRLLGSLDRSLADSVQVTAAAVDALAATVEVADELTREVASTLSDASLAAASAAGGAEAAVEVLDSAADVTGEDVAGSLAAVEDALPALVDVAGVIDTTLGTLDRLPLGPTYDPAVPFDDAVREVQRQLDGVPETLVEEAELLRDGADELADVGRSARFLAEDLQELSTTLRDAGAVLDDVAETADEAARVFDQGTSGLATGLTSARVLVVVLGLAGALGQVAPLGVGLWLLDPDRIARLLDTD